MKTPASRIKRRSIRRPIGPNKQLRAARGTAATAKAEPLYLPPTTSLPHGRAKVVESHPPRTFTISPRSRWESSQREVDRCDRGSAAERLQPALLVGANRQREWFWLRPTMLRTPTQQARQTGLDASRSHLPVRGTDHARGVHVRCTRCARPSRRPRGSIPNTKPCPNTCDFSLFPHEVTTTRAIPTMTQRARSS